MARDMSDKEILKMELDQLKKEVLANCTDTIAFVEERTANDQLIKGVPDDKNPYKGDKGGSFKPLILLFFKQKNLHVISKSSIILMGSVKMLLWHFVVNNYTTSY
uniref:G protein gamma domain-containing protein n=1 Tax=Neogobius melanostomus TaxID=47308 RepID=A0A8C6WIN7_9GOBI